MPSSLGAPTSVSPRPVPRHPPSTARRGCCCGASSLPLLGLAALLTAAAVAGLALASDPLPPSLVGSAAAAAESADADGGADADGDDDAPAAAPSDAGLTGLSPFPPRAPIAPRDNPLAVAYQAVLAEQLRRPRGARTYVVGRPVSGLGNKLRAVALQLAVALHTRRALLLDDALAVPLFPAGFAAPAEPWLVSAVGDVRRALAAHDAGGATAAAAPPSVAHFFHRNKDRSRTWRCWEAAGELGGCGGAANASVLLLETNQPPPESVLRVLLRSARSAAAATAAGGGASPALAAAAAAAPQLSQRALLRLLHWAAFPRLGHAASREVARAQAALGWRGYALVVGLHIRTFVDARRWHVPWRRIRQGYWECVGRLVAGAQAAARANGSSTLIYVASDKPAARPWVRAHLPRALGTVKWHAPAAGFVNSRDTASPGALRGVVVDWALLSEAQLVIGTARSSFAAAAARRSGAAYAVADLRGEKCRVLTQGEVADGGGGGGSGSGGGGGGVAAPRRAATPPAARPG